MRAPGAFPRFDNSAMDGFAVASSRTRGARPGSPVRLPLAGRIAAGDAPTCSPRTGFAWEIMTGAPLPAGCDAVVRVEDARLVDDGRAVELVEEAEAGDFVRRRGSDLARGAVVLAPGRRLGPQDILAAAAAGVGSVRVARRPRVAVIPTGRELVAAGCAAEGGQVHDSSSPFLAAALASSGAECRPLSPCPDDPALFARQLAQALAEEPELLVTTGAVSKGRFDFVPEALERSGARLIFHGVAIRPGKPVLAAAWPGGRLALGLPGNPVSTAAGWRFFVVPVLRAWLGLPAEKPRRLPLEEDVEKPEGLRCFLKASAGERGVRVLPRQASFQVSPLAEANAWAIAPEKGERLPAGEAVDVLPWSPLDPAYPAAAGARRRKGCAA